MNKKIFSIITGSILIALIIGFYAYTVLFRNEYLDKYINKNYPNYTIVSKKYKYLDNFWSTYYDTNTDKNNSDVLCYVTLKNNETGMYITIAFHHKKYRPYSTSKKQIKIMTETISEYEKYWKEINKIKEKYNLELKVSNVELPDYSNTNIPRYLNADIYSIIIYIKNKENVNFYDVADEISRINTNFKISDIYYLIANENVYDELSPWIESNYYYATDSMEKTGSSNNYDAFMINDSRINNNRSFDFYRIKNQQQNTNY